MPKKTRRDGHKTRKPFFPELKTTQNLFLSEKNWDFFQKKPRGRSLSKNPKRDMINLQNVPFSSQKLCKIERVPFYQERTVSKKVAQCRTFPHDLK